MLTILCSLYKNKLLNWTNQHFNVNLGMETCRNGTFISENLRTESESNGSDRRFRNLGPGSMRSLIYEKVVIDMNRENDIGTGLKSELEPRYGAYNKIWKNIFKKCNFDWLILDCFLWRHWLNLRLISGFNVPCISFYERMLRQILNYQTNHTITTMHESVDTFMNQSIR